MPIHELRAAALPAAVLFSLVAGCSEPSASPTQHDKPDFAVDGRTLQAVLEEPIQSCQDQRVVCRDQADSDDDHAACDDSLITCLEAAADQAEAIANAVRECRDEAETCVADGDELDVCRESYENCTETALASDSEDDDDAEAEADESTSDAGVPDEDEGDADVQDDDETDAGGDADGEDDAGRASDAGGVDSAPRGDRGRGIVERLPEPLRCIVELRLCVAADRGAASECADAARMCLRED